MKIRSVEAEFYVDVQTNMMRLIVAFTQFCEFA
jgi:hypothetical protein